MSHRIVLDVSDEAFEELVRIGGDKSETPELVASGILNDLLPDPLLKLAGSIRSPLTDVGERHDDYIGEGIYAERLR